MTDKKRLSAGNEISRSLNKLSIDFPCRHLGGKVIADGINWGGCASGSRSAGAGSEKRTPSGEMGRRRR